MLSGSPDFRGVPVFKGTRVTSQTVLASLAEGDTVEDILADFPSLSAHDVGAAVPLVLQTRHIVK